MEQHLASVWESVAEAVPDAAAVVQGDQVRTWREFDDRAARLARALMDAGVGPGTTVAVDLYNCPEFLETAFAIFKIGACFANVNYRYTAAELAYLLDEADAVAVVFHRSLRDRVCEAATRLPQLSALVEVDDIGEPGETPDGVHAWADLVASTAPAPRATHLRTDLFMFYTGGTTGMPKGVLRPVSTEVMRVVTADEVYDTRASLLGLPLRDDAADLATQLRRDGRAPVTLVACPLMHGVGFTWTSIPTLSVGGTIVLLTSRSFDPDELIETAAARHVTCLSIVGDAFARPLLRALRERTATGDLPDLSSLQRVCSAGVAWHESTKAELLDYLPGATLIEGCGSDGGNYGISYTRRGVARATGSFRCIPGTLVLRDDGTEAPRGEIGRLAAVTHSPGYHKDPERTARTRIMINGVPYVVPGDYGRIEADGSLTLVGRGNSTINTGGEKVFPEEVEGVIKSLASVEDCVVFGSPDERLGQVVAAIVQARDGTRISGEDVVRHVKHHLAGYKAPRRVLIAAVPRYANGKPDFAAASGLLGEAVG